MPIGIIPEGSENALYATISGYGDQVHADEEEAVRAMLRLVRMRRAPLPLLLCQADDGVVMPVLSNGAHACTLLVPSNPWLLQSG